jgi:DNA-binding response OmpR family regulator
VTVAGVDDALAALGRGKRALVIEDDDTSREFAHMVLLRMGFDVIVAEDGLMALNFLDAVDANHFDLAICDIQVPRLSGLSLLSKLRERSTPPVRHLICVSAIDDSGIRRQALDLGASAFLTKPVSLAQLHAEVQRVMRGLQPD